jgi:glucan biosynthesis protein C
MFSVFLYHCARFFDYDSWHVKNAELRYEASVFCLLLGEWIMPLFFVPLGASTYYMLCSRTGRRFVDERFRRLMIPFFSDAIQ